MDGFQRQSFACAIKAIKIGRHARRPHWDVGYELFLDKSILKYIDSKGKLYPVAFIPHDDILADDWIILLF